MKNKIWKSGLGVVLLGSMLFGSTSWGASKSQRDLIVFSNLVSQGMPQYAWLYQFLETSAISLAYLKMGGKYRKIWAVAGPALTKTKFTDEVIRRAKNPTVKALDVFVHLHGSNRRLWFQDGSMSTAAISDCLKEKNLKHKLRALYSTACYGGTQANDFVLAGFKVASGARQVNANSPYDYPTFMDHWGAGKSFNYARAQGNHAGQREFYDGIAKTIGGFKNVDSYKIMKGQAQTRIHLSAL